MDPLTITSITSLAVQGTQMLVGGIMGAVNSKSNHEAQRNELAFQVEQLGAQIDSLEASYRDNLNQLVADRDETIASNNYNLAVVGRNQQEQANLAAIANVASSRNAYEQLRDTQLAGLSSIASAEQNAAVSGFRNTGTNAAAVNEAIRTAGRVYETQRRNVQLSSYQNYMEAANDYFSANIQMEGYRQNIRNANRNYGLSFEALTSEYNANRDILSAQQENYQAQYDAMGEWNGWIGLRDFFAGMI